MSNFNVTGMSCAACSARVEKAVSAVPGVSSCSVNLLTNSMSVEGEVSDATIIEAVVKAGYGATVKGSASTAGSAKEQDELTDTAIPMLKKRLIWSVLVLAVLMYISMGHMMWGWPLPKAMADNHVGLGLIQLLLTVIVMVINQRFFISGGKAIINAAPNMDTLVALGSMAAFIYSCCMLYLMCGAAVANDSELMMSYGHEFYFESAAMILTLITVGKLLEARSKGKTTDAIKSLMKLAPKTAAIEITRQDEQTGKVITEIKTVPLSEVKVGDICVVKPGESIPVDGIVTEGNSAVDESALTGESIPVDKQEGSEVYSASINQSGYIKLRATKVGQDTTLSQIITMVGDAAASKAPIAKIADKVSGVFVPCVITIALVTTAVWLIAGASVGYALARGISVLVISCPCALGLATPVAIMVGNGVAAKHGVMFKNATSLEHTGKSQIVVLDKTGTVTKGQPKVVAVVPAASVSEDKLLSLAKTVEARSEHPLAKAIMEYEKGSVLEGACENFEALAGSGVICEYNGCKLLGGSLEYIASKVNIDRSYIDILEAKATEGLTPLVFAYDGAFIGAVCVGDTIKEDSAEAIDSLKQLGLRVVMLTGDNKRTAGAIAAKAGIDCVVSDVYPDQKGEVIDALAKLGKVIMVGDGINDAPALTKADIGIAIGAGADIAIDAADVVLMKSSLMDVVTAVRVSKATFTNICENLFWAFFYNVCGIPLAAGVWIPLLGLELSPMYGAAAMSLSSFFVVSNALRLNRVPVTGRIKRAIVKNRVDIPSGYLDGYMKKWDKAEQSAPNNKKDEVNVMEKTMKIEGMMCGHCEANVKKALEALDGVTEAIVSHESGTAVVKMTEEVSDEILKKAVEDKDYKVISL